MAFLLKSSVASHFRQTVTNSDSLSLTRRHLHVAPGPREQALLAADPSLRRFKSHKKGVLAIRRIRKLLPLVVLAGCCYEIYIKAGMKQEAKAQA
ncbi:succinate dehydrogenase subunit 7B, mitochondrial-like [Argentina anserina]|uniref:succinate dehydrogenase subunit 7B, mitochondrial-like n=1 Tax=Argentina anserina TaxID=57926 RepID=UPI002176466F|nr:succinate dehydrogenase subunit 7B, mitochondrial-like [Potentilla anserina]